MNMLFYPETLKTVREFRSLTQKELAARAGLSQQQGLISKIESGKIVPSSEQLDAIAFALGYPSRFFTEVSVPASGLAFHRKKTALSAKLRIQLEAEAKLKKAILSKVLQYDCQPNLLSSDEIKEKSPQEIAIMLRRKWKLSPGRIDNLVKVVESQGILVLKYDFGTPLLDGFFMPGAPCCLFLNSKVPNDRLRFSIAHELGHLILQHTIPGKGAEAEANSFAAEFLLPQADIVDDLKNRLSVERLAELKKKWYASMASLLYRAQTLELIVPSYARRLWTEFSSLGFKLQEPALDIPEEHPTVIRKILQLTYGNAPKIEEIASKYYLNEGDLRNCFNSI